MSTSIAKSSSHDKLCRRFHFALIEQIVPRQRVRDLLTTYHKWEKRERKLNQVLMVYFVIVMTMFPDTALTALYAHLTQLFRWCEQIALSALPTAAAFGYRRRQLGVRLFRTLLADSCPPLADPVLHPQAFFGRYRLMAVDGRLQDVQDTPANRRFFGKRSNSPFPHVHLVSLIEVGTRACCDLVYGIDRSAEARLIWGLLRSMRRGMLVLWDRGFMSADLTEAVRARGAHILSRLSPDTYVTRWKTLSDGSYLVRLLPGDYEGLQRPLILRVIEYQLVGPEVQCIAKTTPSRSTHGSTSENPGILQRHRLVTTLLNPRCLPAMTACLLYHERWEIEIAYDEQKDHLWQPHRPLRSKFPVGVLQELYSLALGQYVIQWMMLEAATQGQQDPDRISFKRARQLVQDVVIMAVAVPQLVESTLLQRVASELILPHNLVAPRRLRFNSRVVKQVRSRYRIKHPEHVFLTFKKMCFQQLIQLI